MVSAGILNQDQVMELTISGSTTMRLHDLANRPLKKCLVDGSAIDIPLGDKYWKMRGSCRTGNKYKVADLIQKYALQPPPKDLGTDLVVLKKQQVYLFKADCILDLTDLTDQTIQGKATGKSSVGRLDVLVRLLVDGSAKFDVVEKDKKHELYVEVTPISFDLLVKRGTSLSQLRLYKGREEDISLTRGELFEEDDDNFPVLDREGNPQRSTCLSDSGSIWYPFCLDLTPDPETGVSAYVVKECKKGFSPINPSLKSEYDPHDYWESIEWENGAILLEPDRLYIMRSKERLRIPGHLALECKSYTTEMGEWRIEYAGFAHPYFGSMREDNKGSPIMFEVRGHNVPTILTDEIPLGNARFLRMSRAATEPKKMGTYEEQELKLSKCFSSW